MVQSEINEKFLRILYCLLEPGCRQTTDDYFELLITHLSTKANESDNVTARTKYSSLLKSQQLFQWIRKSIDQFGSDFTQKPQVFAFTLNVLSLVINEQANESQLDDFDENLLSRIANCMQVNQTPSIKLAFVRVLKSLIQHPQTAGLIQKNEFWQPIVNFCLENKTVYVVRESKEFLKQLIFESVPTNRQLCWDICQLIAKPIKEIILPENGVIPVDGDDLQRTVSPCLAFLSYLLNGLLNEVDPDKQLTLQQCLNEMNIEADLWQLKKMTKNPIFFKEILFTLASLNMIRLKCDRKDLKEHIFYVEFVRQIIACSENNPKTILSLANFYLNVNESHLILIPDETNLKLFDLLIIIIAAPIISTCQQIKVNCKLSNLINTSTYQKQFEKIPILNQNNHPAVDLIIHSIQLLMDAKHLLNSQFAISIAEALILCFSKQRASRNELNLIIGIKTFIKHYFKECYESNILFELINSIIVQHEFGINSLDGDDRFSVEIIQILQLIIENMSTENVMTNCVNHSDEKCGSQLCCIFSCTVFLLNQLKNDLSWEIKDSLIELLTKIAAKAPIYKKFEEFLQQNLPWSAVIFDMAKHDQEPFVRASSLKCLSNLLILNSFWNTFDVVELMKHLLHTAHTESEGIVRKEVVNVIRQIYDHHILPPNYLNQLYSTLAYCAVDDLHWEVRVVALDFWSLFIQKSFQNEGLCIQRKTYGLSATSSSLSNSDYLIKNVFKILSEKGVFGILLECTKDDSDIVILRKISEMFKTLENILQENKCQIFVHLKDATKLDEIPSKSTESSSDNMCLNYPDSVMDDSILQSVIQSNDINFVSESLSVNNAKHDEQIDEKYFQKFSKTNDSEFFAKIKFVDKFLQEKSDWMDDQQDLNCLLDDIMCALKLTDVNNMECY